MVIVSQAAKVRPLLFFYRRLGMELHEVVDLFAKVLQDRIGAVNFRV